jgi:hypothetical protein
MSSKIKFTKERNYLQNKLKKLPRYCTSQEKEVLLIDESESTYADYLDILLPNLPENLKPINEIEEMLYLIYLRSNSVSDIISGIVECPSCKQLNDYNIETDDMINLEYNYSDTFDDFEDNFPIGVFTCINQIINKKEQNKIIVKDYNKIQSKIQEQNEKIFNIHRNIKCRKCSENIDIVINPKMILSKLSLVGIYEEYMLLSYYSHNSKLDIDSMYPFERELIIGLLKKKIESSPPGLGG